ncbi:MAG TPA: hypothetical protein VGM27_23245 [Acidobacteriaceae bacterium]
MGSQRSNLTIKTSAEKTPRPHGTAPDRQPVLPLGAEKSPAATIRGGAMPFDFSRISALSDSERFEYEAQTAAVRVMETEAATSPSDTSHRGAEQPQEERMERQALLERCDRPYR